MSKHTPGPWEFSSATGDIVDTKERTICIINDNEEDEICCETCGGSWRANAQLIAAAPELLAACKTVEKHFVEVWGIDSDQAYRAVVAAIKKAEGR